jgi:hypothetical protein
VNTEIFRRRNLNLLDEAEHLCSYDELPLIPAKIDLQLTASRNTKVQPFFFCAMHDMVLAFLSGTGRVEFRNSPLAFSSVKLGDYLYIPARTPHRVFPDSPLITVRYKLCDSGLEAAIWYCDGCEAEVNRYEYDSGCEIPQEQWGRACQEYNSKIELRTCRDCGAANEPLDLSGLRWGEIGEALRAEKVSVNSQENG